MLGSNSSSSIMSCRSCESDMSYSIDAISFLHFLLNTSADIDRDQKVGEKKLRSYSIVARWRTITSHPVVAGIYSRLRQAEFSAALRPAQALEATRPL